MKKALIIIIVLIIAFGAFTVYGQSRLGASADELEFRLETMSGDASAAESLVINGYVTPLHDGYEHYGPGQKYYIWTSDIRIENGQAVVVSNSVERDAIRQYEITTKWPDHMVEIDYSARQHPQAEDLAGKVVYKVYQQDGYYCADVTDAASGTVNHTVRVAECDGDIWKYPKLFAGRGSVVIVIVEDQAKTDPGYGWYAGKLFCLTADGELIEIGLKQYTFSGRYFYPTRGTGFFSVMSVNDKVAIVQRETNKVIHDDAGEGTGLDLFYIGASVWVFGRDGLEYAGLIRCSLYDAYICGEYVPGGEMEGDNGCVRSISPYYNGYETLTTISW